MRFDSHNAGCRSECLADADAYADADTDTRADWPGHAQIPKLCATIKQLV